MKNKPLEFHPLLTLIGVETYRPAMRSSNITACYLIRIACIVLCLAYSAWIATSMLHPMVSSLISRPALGDAISDVIIGALALAMSGAFVWLAWRLSRSWNAATVRWFIGIWMAVLLLCADVLPMGWTTAANSRAPDMVSSALAIPLLIIGAIAFRYASHRLIRFAGLADALDIYGQPVGHQSRIRAFATLLGWAIFLAGCSVDEWGGFRNGTPSWREGAAALGPMILGYFTYKLIIWFAKPRTRPSLPAGGFEVITNAPPVAHPAAKVT